MSVFAVNIKGGDDLKVVRNASAQMYFTYYAILPVWGYGDPSHRSKLFITGFCRTLGMGQAVRSFNFPEPIFEDHCNHTARDWAVPDDQVPNNCWRKDNTSRISQQQPSNGQIHYLSSAGAGMGPPDCPNKVASWDATAPGPTSLNGNNRRPKLSWIDTGFNTVGPSRVTSQVEVPRMPSLPFDYRAWVSKFDSSSGFLWKCGGFVSDLRFSFFWYVYCLVNSKNRLKVTFSIMLAKEDLSCNEPQRSPGYYPSAERPLLRSPVLIFRFRLRFGLRFS